MAVTYIKVKNPQLYRYNNGEFYDFMLGVSEDIPKDEEEIEDGPVVQGEGLRASLGASAISVSAELLDEFKAKLGALKILLRPAQSSVETELLAAADDERENAANYLLDRIKAAANSPIQAEREAGKLLQSDFGGYNGLEQLRVNDKSGVIAGMVAKFALPEYASAIQQLGIQPAIDELNRQNELYRSLASQRRDSVRKTRPEITTKEARAALSDLFEEIYDRAFATNLLDRSEEAKTFMERVNDRIDEMIARLNNSDAQRGDSQKTETPEQPSEENPSTETPGTETPSGENPDTETPDTENPSTPPTGETEEPDDRPVVQ